MDAAEQLQKVEEFLEEKKAGIAEQVRHKQQYFEIPFQEILEYDPALAEELLEKPEDIIKACEIAIREMDIETKKVQIRFFDLPQSANVKIKHIRSVHLGKLIQLDGVVRQKSDVRPQMTVAKFECPACGQVHSIPQIESKYQEPSRCGCGYKGKFKELDKELVDAQRIVLEENPEKLEGGEQPKRINLFLKEDLVSPIGEKKTNPGSSIVVTGVLKEVPVQNRTGATTTRFDLVIEANSVKPRESSFLDLVITKEEEERIKELAQDPNLYAKLEEAIAPSIYGHDNIKRAVLLQLFGGVHKKRSDGVITRGDMHLLLIGDPGAGKCVSEETEVISASGNILPIKELEHTREGVIAINEYGKIEQGQNIRFWKRSAPKKMMQIKTQSGNTLTVTPEHPLFTTEHGIIFGKRADEYKEGDYLATPRKISIQGILQNIPLNYEKSKARNKKESTIFPILHEPWARLLGYLIGDGYVAHSQTSGWISFTNNNQDLLTDFEQCVSICLGRTLTKRESKESYEYYLTSKELVNLLESIDEKITKRSIGKRIPKSILESPDNMVSAFLKALFDCEGHVRKKRKEIEFCTKSKELAKQVKLTLLRFGIVARLSEISRCATNTKEKTKRMYYRIIISGEDVELFGKHIGFLSTQKQATLDAALALPNNTNKHIIPGLASILKHIRNDLNKTQSEMGLIRSSYQHYEKGDRAPSREQLQKIATTMPYGPWKSFLTTLAATETFWDKIVSMKEVEGKGEVYDIEVERVHNFVANGVVVHNSQLLKRANIVAPKSRYVSGKGASGAGLTAAVVKDEFLGGWSLEAGALVLASDGLCCIDELDKMTTEDRSAMHEALEQQTISISKANIQATLTCKTTVLAAANPKFGRFDPYSPIVAQIDLPPPLISRFDLIFPIRDLPDVDLDEKKASHILSLHQNPNIAEPEVTTELLRKYIAYAKRIHPIITDGAMDEIKRYYVDIRNRNQDGNTKSVPITARQLEALVRMSEAFSRMRLSTQVTRKEARTAIELLHDCLSQVGVDPETGKIDTDIISTGVSSSQRGKIMQVKDIINDLEKQFGKAIPLEEVYKTAEEREISKENCEQTLEKLKRSGDIFEPKPGVIQKL